MKYQRTIWWMVLGAVAMAISGPTLFSGHAVAQSWLPWTTREQPRRQPPRRAPQRPSFGQTNNGNNQAYGGGRSAICLQLEQRLARDAQNQSNSQGTIQRLRQDLSAARRKQRRAERDLDRRDCYERFLFTRSLRPSRTCRKLDQVARRAGRQVEEITFQLRQFQSGNRQDRQDEIVRALARNNCGANYQQEARRREGGFSSNFWQDNEGEGARRGPGNLFGGLPFATYRTVCVRLCDGYYFPVSFSTLPTHFGRDTDVCQSQCAAPTELYFHQNPGGSVDQMVSQRTQQPYTTLPTAFRYRKEFVQGCSCKQAEYVPQGDGTAVSQAPTPAAPAVPGAKQNNLSPNRH